MKMIERFDANKRGRDFFVGDIHGHRDQLLQQLGELGFKRENDRLFSVGDLIDRGPDSMGCLELVEEPWFFATLGNHEELFIDRFNRRYIDQALLHRRVGGKWADVLEDDEERCKRYLKIVLSLPVAIEVKVAWGRVGVVHAQVKDNDWDEQVSYPILDAGSIWHATRYMDHNKGEKQAEIANIDIVVSGHVNAPKPTLIENQIYIDTLQRSGSLSILSSDDLLAQYEKKRG